MLGINGLVIDAAGFIFQDTVFGGKLVYVELSLIETISPSQASNPDIEDVNTILGVGKFDTCTLLFVKLF